MDALTDVLRRLRLRTNVFLHSSFCGAWAVGTSGQGKAAFHVIARGDCWLHLAGEAPVPLQGGDLLVFPRDAAHLISSRPAPPGPGVPLNRPAQGDTPGPATSLVCGYFEFDSRAWNPIVEALPEVIVLRGGEYPDMESMDALIRLIINEAEGVRTGADVMLDRLCDALFIHVVRAVMRRAPSDAGYLAALADRHLSLALRDMHARPAEPWTVDALARAAGMSRSAFAGRFHQIVGMTPLRYLTRWRMQLARDWLSEPGLAIIDIAERAGYGSEAAFTRAFKRVFALTPGEARRRSRQTQ